MPSKKNKKKMKESAKSTQHKEEIVTAVDQLASVDNAENVGEVAEAIKDDATPVVAVEQKTEEKSDSSKKDKKKKEKKPSKLKAKTKEVVSELKKVTWPTFPQIMKKTGVVLAVVAIFAVVLLGIDKLLQVVYDLFIGNLK